MKYDFEISNKKLQGLANTIAYNHKYKKIALGYYNNDYLIELIDIQLDQIIASLKTTYVQCLSLVFIEKRNQLLFLGVNEAGGVDLCLANDDLKSYEVKEQFSISMYPCDLQIDEQNNLVLILGRQVELRSLSDLSLIKTFHSETDHFKKGVFLSDKKQLIIQGLENNKVQRFSFSNLNQIELTQEFELPFLLCKQFIISQDQSSLLLISQVGMFGNLMIHPETFKSLYTKKFNDDALNSHFLFLQEENMIAKIGRSGSSILKPSTNYLFTGARYPSSKTRVSCSITNEKDPTFCFVNDDNTLYKITLKIKSE